MDGESGTNKAFKDFLRSYHKYAINVVKVPNISSQIAKLAIKLCSWCNGKAKKISSMVKSS